MKEEKPTFPDYSQILPQQPVMPSSITGNTQSITESIDGFILGEKIGEGTFGTVHLATHIVTQEQVAVKILNKVKIYQREHKTRVEREIKILKCLRHHNIAQLFSVIQTIENIYLILEYVKGKELFEHIISNQKLSESEACVLYRQIISGLEYLHTLQIAHRDLKPENLLLDQRNTIKIVDFGLSNEFEEDELLSTPCGSPCYAAPEMLSNSLYKAPGCDVWSSGIILYAMLCGYLPFEDINNEALYRKIIHGTYVIPSHLSYQAQDLIRRVLSTDPIDRLSISQIKSHPWFNMNSAWRALSPGLLININVIPIEEDIVTEMDRFGYKKEEVRSNVLSNRHNDISTTYYLLLLKAIRNNKQSIADLTSKEFISFIQDKQNLFVNFNNNFNDVIAARAAIPEVKQPKANTEKISIRKKRYMNMTISSTNKEYKVRNKGDSVDSMKSKMTLCHYNKEKKSYTKGGNIGTNEHNVNKSPPSILKRKPFYLSNKEGARGNLKKSKEKHVVSYSDDSTLGSSNKKNGIKKSNGSFQKGSIYLSTNTDTIEEKCARRLSPIVFRNSANRKQKSQSKHKDNWDNAAIQMKRNDGYSNRYNRNQSKAESKKRVSVKDNLKGKHVKLIFLIDEASNCRYNDHVCATEIAAPSSYLRGALLKALRKCKIEFRSPHVRLAFCNPLSSNTSTFVERIHFSLALNL